MASDNPAPNPDPILEGELADSAARVLGMALRAALFALPVLLVVTGLLRTWQETSAVAVLLGLTVVMFLLQRSGRLALALQGFICALVVYGAAGVAIYGSIRSSATLAFIAAIVVSGIFLRPKFLVFVTATCIAAIGALIFAESTEGWPRPDFATGPHTWIVYAVVLAALAFITFYGRSLIVTSLYRAHREIGERERAQAALYESERLYRNTFELAGSGIAHIDPANGRVLRVNRRLCEILGYDEGELLTRTVKGLSHPEDRDVADATIQRLYRNEISTVRVEKRYLRKDGAVVWVTVMVALQRDVHGAPLYEVAVFHDVTERRKAETALRASEEHRKRVFRASPAAMTVVDYDSGVLLDMNAAAEALTGVRREDAIGKPTNMFYADNADRERLRARLERESRLINVPVTYRRPDDGALVETITSLELAQDGERRLVIGIMVDVTAETRARAALRASEERFTKVFFSLPVNLAINRLADGVYVEVNDPPELALGRTREELIGRSGSDIGLWPDERERERFRRAFERDGRLIAYEARLRHKSGEIVDCMIWATRIDLDGEACILSSTSNVTEQKRREALLLEVAQGVAAQIGADFFEQLVLHFARALGADQAIAGEILGGDVVRTLAVVQDGGVVPALRYELRGSPCDTLRDSNSPRIYADGVAELFPEMDLLRQAGARAYIGACLRDADGTPIGVLNAVFRRPLAQTQSLEPLFRIFAARAQAELQRMRHDRLIEGLNASLEQRVRERTTQLEAAVRELEAFSYSVSHDLRAPLRAIGSFAHMVAEDERAVLSPEGQRRLGVIEQNAVRMGQLIDELLQLARVPRRELRREGVDLGEAATPFIEALRTTYPATEVRIGALPEAHGDPTLLLQVLANLLDNAFKFSQRAAKPRVEMGWSKSKGAWYVRDNGIGFDMQYADKLFGTFERLHSEREFPGTGVGLAIVKRIVERHGGRIWAESRPGAGATFYFNLEAAARRPARAAAAGTAPGA